jgi:hypothetical protein
MTNFSDYFWDQLAEKVAWSMKFNSMNDKEMAIHMMDFFDSKEVCYLAIHFMFDASKETNRGADYWHRVRNEIEKL